MTVIRTGSPGRRRGPSPDDGNGLALGPDGADILDSVPGAPDASLESSPQNERAAPIRVVLGEDSYLLREGITQLFQDSPEIELVGTGGDLAGIEAAVAATNPDVVVTDIRMPPTYTDEGLRLAHQLRTERPEVGVVILSHHAEPEYALALLEPGAAGRAYLLKERISDLPELLNAIREVRRGGSVIDPTVVDILFAARSKSAQSPLATLTPRERDVLAQLGQGKTNAAIASALTLTDRAVEKHINSIFAKLNVNEHPDVHRRVKAALMFLADQTG